MERLMRTVGRAEAVALACAVFGALSWPAPVAAFDAFGDLDATATFGEALTFRVELDGGAPEELELLLRFGDDEVTFVQPVEAEAGGATYVWDASEDYITPNTPIHYRWRATNGTSVIESEEETILYDDDRPGLDWRVAESDQARVHWYSGGQALAERFLEITSGAVERAEALFGAELGGPVDIFAYESEEDFFGALDLGPREWVGGQASSGIRTIYIRLDVGGEEYMEPLLIHEVTHIVFDDATENPYHAPAHWLDEGLAVWAETQDAAGARAAVERAADDEELMGFDAIAEQFPVEDERARLAYAQSAALVDEMIDTYGTDAIARLMAAYRQGSTDAAAIEAATGVTLDEIVDAWFAGLGQEVPEPIEPQPLLPAEGELPENTADPDRPVETAEPGESPRPRDPGAASPGAMPWILAGGVLVVGAATLVGVVVLASRRPAYRPPGGPGGDR